MINSNNFFKQIDAIYAQLTNRDNVDKRVPILDENKNLIFVEPNDPRVKDSSVNQLEYITSKFKELAAPFKDRPYAVDRPTISLSSADRETLMNKLNLIRQTSLGMARDQQSYKKMTMSYLGSFIKTEYDPILKAKIDMEKSFHRIDECVVIDPKIDISNQIHTVVANLRQAAKKASQSIFKSINDYENQDKTMATAENCLTDVNSALNGLRSSISKSGRDVEDVLKHFSANRGRALLEDPAFKEDLKVTLQQLYETFASISDSLSPPTQALTQVMSRLYFTPDSEGISQNRVNASPEEKTYNTKLSQLNSLAAFIHRIKDQKDVSPATLVLTLDLIRTLISDLAELEKAFPSLIRQKINNENDNIAKFLESIAQEKQNDPVNEQAITRLREQIRESEATVKERMAALEGIRSLINQPIAGNAKDLITEMDQSPLLQAYGPEGTYERPLTIDSNFWLLNGLEIGSFKELQALDKALLDHERVMDGMRSCRNNPLKALRELDETVFGIAALPPIDKEPKK